MLKRDPIFWWASGVFFAMLALFVITHNQFWLVLTFGAYLLRPTLASVGTARKYVDEREMNLHYRSGNVGFAVLLIMCVLCLAKLELEGNHNFEFFAAAIIVGMAARVLFHVILAKNFREGAAKIIVGAGLLIALFSVLDEGSPTGIVLAALPGLAIAGIGLLSRKFPRVVGILAIAAACLLVFLVLTIGLRNSGSMSVQILTAILVGVPLITAGVFLLIKDRATSEC